MSPDLDERIALRFPGMSRQLLARVLALPRESPVRRRVLKRTFRTHGGTSHPAGGVFRTPEARFESLPDFAFEPNYRTVGNLRLAHIDVGEGAPVVMIHGEPAWSLIWRKVIPPIRDAGYRCIAPDLAGFGRSDKPIDPGWQSFERHVELMGSLLEELDLHDVSLVLHDFGGPIGLMLAIAEPDRIARIVILDTAIDSRDAWMNETWVRTREFVESTSDFPVGELMRATCLDDPGEEVIAAYEAPFPLPESQGWRGLMMSVPHRGDKSAAAAADAFCDALRRDPRPILFLWAESDAFLTLASGQRLATRIGRHIDHVIPQSGHALPEDQGQMISKLIVDWLDGGD